MFLRAFSAFRRSFAASLAFVGGGRSFSFRACAGGVDENWRYCWGHGGEESERKARRCLGKWLLERRNMLSNVEDMLPSVSSPEFFQTLVGTSRSRINVINQNKCVDPNATATGYLVDN